MAEGSVFVTSDKTVQLPAGLKILVVDPDPVSRSRLKSTLRGMGQIEAVSEMSSSIGVLDLLAEQSINIIMIDQNPGGGEVYDIVDTIRKHGVAAKVRWVLVSEQFDEAIIAKAKAVGIGGFLPRPFDIRRLERALMNAVGVRPKVRPTGRAKEAQDQLRETLKKLRMVSLFSGFTDQELVRLMKICKTRNISKGNYVFHEGEPGYNLYVVVTGDIDIKKTIAGEARTLVSMGPGDCFGEMAIIAAEPRFADAVAASDCTLIEVNEAVVNSNEDMLSLKLVRQIAILLARKLRAR